MRPFWGLITGWSLGPQSRVGGKPLGIREDCSENGPAVKKGQKRSLTQSRLRPKTALKRFQTSNMLCTYLVSSTDHVKIMYGSPTDHLQIMHGSSTDHEQVICISSTYRLQIIYRSRPRKLETDPCSVLGRPSSCGRVVRTKTLYDLQSVYSACFLGWICPRRQILHNLAQRRVRSQITYYGGP